MQCIVAKHFVKERLKLGTKLDDFHQKNCWIKYVNFVTS